MMRAAAGHPQMGTQAVPGSHKLTWGKFSVCSYDGNVLSAPLQGHMHVNVMMRVTRHETKGSRLHLIDHGNGTKPGHC